MSRSIDELTAASSWLALPSSVSVNDGSAASERLQTAKIFAIGTFAILLIGLLVAYRATNRRIQRDADEATLEAAFEELEAGSAQPPDRVREEQEV
jgi:hypothetical protein